jgi:hypothetical protein
MIPLSIVCGLALVALVSWWATSPSSKGGRSLPVKRRRIVGLDLSQVRAKAMKRHGWSEEKALALESEYKDFLILLAEQPGETVSPWTDDLDLFWHEHILDTVRYAGDCQWVFGRVIHHDPHIERSPEKHRATRDRTVALRKAQMLAREARTSGTSSGGDAFIGTYGCGTVDDTAHTSHGHSDVHGHSCAGGGDSGHGGGGHSCGGHGCGGHGCGGH